MKKLIIILTILFLSVSGYSQFVFKYPVASAKMDTLLMNRDTLYLVNKQTKAICKAVVVNGALKIQNIYTFTDTLVKFRQFVDSINNLKATKLSITGTAANSALWQGKDSVYWKALIALKKSSNDTLLRTGYTPLGRFNDSIAAVWARAAGISSMVYPGEGIPLSTGSTWGTSITNNSTNWNTAYGWGNHASAGYLTSESDPVYSTSDSAYLKGNVRELLALTDTTSELVARTIYINQNTGNDTTGTGLVSAPFRTFFRTLTSLKKVIGCEITLLFSIGTHTIRHTDLNYLTNNLIFISKNEQSGMFTLTGTTVDLTSLLTFTKDATNPFKFSVSGAAWTVNQFEGCFLRNSTGTTFRPIESNTSNTIEGALSYNNTGSHYICSDSTTLNFTGLTEGMNFAVKSFINPVSITKCAPINFVKVKIRTNTDKLLSYGGFQSPVSFLNCNITGNKRLALSCGPAFLRFEGSFIKFNNTGTGSLSFATYGNSSTLLYFCVIKNNSNTYGVAIPANFDNSICVQYSVISNFLKAFSYTHKGNISVNASLYVKNCTYLIYSTNDLYCDLNLAGTNYCLENVTNLIYTTFTPLRLRLSLNSNLGYTNIYATASPYKGILFSPANDISITIPSTYPEYQQKQSYTLADNSTDSISIADLTYNRTVTITYNIVRNGVYRAGTMKVLITGTNYYFDPGEFFPAANDLGITFDGVYRSGTSNTLKLKWTTTNTGFAATITIDYNRQNF